MPGELSVHVNRDELHAVDVQPSFEAHDSFDVRLVNHGESLHVHLHLDDGLSRVARIGAANHHVDGNSERVVRVEVDDAALGGEPIRGKMKIATAYGAETRWVDVTLDEPDVEDESVRVDESLSKPKPAEPTDEPSALTRPEVPVLALGAVALFAALLAAVVLEDMLVLVGSLIVLAGVLVALFFLTRG